MSPKRTTDDDRDATLAQQPQPMEDESTAMDVEVTHTTTTNIGPSEGIVYVAVDGYMSRIMEIKVKEGDSIYAIKEEIKESASNTFASCDAVQLRLFQSKEQTTKQKSNDEDTEQPLTPALNPMDATTKWDSEVTWGTEEQPLIVQTPQPPINTDYPNELRKGQLFIDSIMRDYEEIPNSNGMKLLRDLVDIETGRVGNAVIRDITESFWLKVIEMTEKKRVCALGTPGVGKTTTTFILIRLLLEQNKTVVYHVRRKEYKGYLYMFIPTFNKSTNMDIDIKVIEEAKFHYMDNKFNKESIYYVVDPGKTRVDCNLEDDFLGKVIIITSPDDVHWGGTEFEKERREVMGIFLCFPVWYLYELLKARPYLNSNLTEIDVEERYQEVGGIPRHVFTDNATFTKFIRNQENAINRLSAVQVRRLALGDVASAQTLGEDQPKSILMVYECFDPNFEEFTVSVSSRRVARLLVENHKQTLWNVILDRGGARGSTTWQLFELYCQNLMLGNNFNNYFDYRYHDGTSLKEVSNVALQLGNCSKIKETRESLIVAAKREESENIVFYSSDRFYPLYDFLYRKGNIFYAFQVSIGKEHSCKPYQLNAAIEEAGNEYQFLLHYLTFDERYDDFELNPVNPFSVDNSIPIKSSLANDWTIKVIRVPSPNEDHGGPSKKIDRKFYKGILTKDQTLKFLNLPVSGNEPPFIERLLGIDAGKLYDAIPQFRRVELQACLRALQLPSNRKKEILIRQLQNEEQKLSEVIEGLRNSTELASIINRNVQTGEPRPDL